MTPTLSDHKLTAPRVVITGYVHGIEMRVSFVRLKIYGRTSPRPGLCDFDAFGMDIIEGRA